MQYLDLLLVLLGLVSPPVLLYAVFRVKTLATWSRILFIAILLLLASNFTLWPYLFLKDPFPRFYYESNDHSFRGVETTKVPGSYHRLERAFLEHEASNGSESLQLRRTFRRRPHAFWRWADYLIEPRYELPFIEANYCPFSDADERCSSYPSDAPPIH